MEVDIDTMMQVKVPLVFIVATRPPFAFLYTGQMLR